MWTSDLYLKMYIEGEQRERLAQARCAQAANRATRIRRLLQTMDRAKHELDAADRRESVRRGQQPLADCN